MIALPPPSVERCVEATSQAARYVVATYEIRGDATKVAAVMKYAPAKSTVVSDRAEGSTRRVLLRLDMNVSYREIGGFVYEAQANGLNVDGRFEPPICEMDKK